MMSETAATHSLAQSADSTILLRRYTIAPDAWDQFLEVWHRIIAVRERHGFTVLFAFEDRETNVFTWSVEYHGDIEAAAARYYADPARRELEIVGQYVTGFEVTTVK